MSVPKAGTHLLERALCLHPWLYRALLPTLIDANVEGRGGLKVIARSLRPGQIAFGHLEFNNEYPDLLDQEDVRTLFLVRDPRDVAVSAAFYVASTISHPFYRRFQREGTTRRRLLLAIQGDEAAGVPPLSRPFRRLEGWLDSGALIVRFEELIGEQGGGSWSGQKDTIGRIFAHLGVPAETVPFEELRNEVFSSSSPTFRRGAIGQWREHFDDEIEDAFRTEMGTLPARYGYRG